MVHLDRCAWKMVEPTKFEVGQSADRCGEVAAVKILRPYRKSDLFLCENHINEFIKHWGLHNEVEILCHNWMEGYQNDPPPAKLVADPALITHRISSGTKVPKEGRTCTCRNGCKAWDCDGGK